MSRTLILALLMGVTPAFAAAAPGHPWQPARPAAQTGQAASEKPRPQQQPQGQVEEVISVTATRLPMPLEDLSALTQIASATELRLRPSLGLDEALRWSPQLSLFRRAPARAAHPTTQGINLRGVAPSGTSRALVLVDGVPLTDAFGGWVQWDRVPALAVERVEIAYGGGPAPYGNQALAGTVQLLTWRPETARGFRVRALAGNQNTWDLGATAGTSAVGGGVVVTAAAFGTDGYLSVQPDARGAVDRPLTSRRRALLARARLGSSLRAHLDAFSADRNNGTPEQTNGSDGFAVAASWNHATAASGWHASAFGGGQEFRSRFSSIAAGRDSEIPVLDQVVPSADLGASAYRWGRLGSHTLSFGGDWRRVSGRSEEQVLTFPVRREPGGTQNVAGGFVAAQLRPVDAWIVDASLRYDGWHNAPRDGSATASRGTWSPRAGVVWQPDADWAVRATAYRSFRAPTLNELYRQFRVGNVLTLANPELTEERLTGAEAGFSWRTRRGGRDLRLGFTAYWNRLDDAIVNATLEVSPALIQRRRENLGAARVLGLEVDGRLETGRIEINAALVWLDGEVLATGDAAASSAGKRLPQVPTFRGRIDASYRAGRGVTLRAAAHAVGEQFDDDLNRDVLASGVTVDTLLEWQARPGLALSLQAQNLFDERLAVGRQPVLIVGPPRSVVLAVHVWPSANE